LASLHPEIDLALREFIALITAQPLIAVADVFGSAGSSRLISELPVSDDVAAKFEAGELPLAAHQLPRFVVETVAVHRLRRVIAFRCRVTPAMAQRLNDRVWTIGELVTACSENALAKPRKVHRRFTVIQGGRPD
jgi:hypothetical protein